jgi:hypothetical protein
VVRLIKSGRFWMLLWLAALVIVTIWDICTALFWMDSVRNVNAMSAAALLFAVAAGVQTTLTMRKADSSDDF